MVRSITSGGIHPQRNFIEDPPAARGPFASVAVALREQRDEDAVRHFLDARAANPAAADEVTLRAVREQLGEATADRLVRAFALLACPHCRAGLTACARCAGSGRGEERRNACTGCISLGVSPCDFCGGSGFATYNFMPTDLRAPAAAVRTQLAVAAVADALATALPTKVARERLRAVRKALAKEVLQLGRHRAVLVNAAQFARSLRAAGSGNRAFTGRLFARSSRAAKAVELRMSQTFQRLAAVSRGRATSAGDEDTESFEDERARLFEEEAGQLKRAARRKAALFPGH